MVHLCEWLTLSQVSSEEINRKDKTRKIRKKKKKKEKIEKRMGLNSIDKNKGERKMQKGERGGN